MTKKTEAKPATPESPFGQLGERLRQQRKAQGKSLNNVADATGLSIGFLSQIERNLATPSLSSLATVAQVLGLSIVDLVGAHGLAGPDTHQTARETYTLADGQVRYERLSSSFKGSTLHSVKFTMPQGYRSETVSHFGEEFVFVLTGSIEYRVASDQYLLNAGDSLHFDAKIPHSVESMPTGQGFAEVLWAGTLDIFEGVNSSAGQSFDAAALTGTEFHGLSLMS